MVKSKKFDIFALIAISYAILIFYLSVTSDLGPLIDLLKRLLGHETKALLIHDNLSFITDFLIDLLKFVTGTSLDQTHVAVYFGFGVLLYFVFSNSRNPMIIKYSMLFAIFTATAYGILNEIFQIYIPSRVASMSDVLSDLIGVTLAQIFIITLILAQKKAKQKKSRLP